MEPICSSRKRSPFHVPMRTAKVGCWEALEAGFMKEEPEVTVRLYSGSRNIVEQYLPGREDVARIHRAFEPPQHDRNLGRPGIDCSTAQDLWMARWRDAVRV